MVRFEIKISDLEKEVWNFCLIRDTLYLNSYSFQKKESTRHRKYNVLRYYDRLMERDSNISESEVPITNEIKVKALKKYFDSIDCKLWSERSL